MAVDGALLTPVQAWYAGQYVRPSRHQECDEARMVGTKRVQRPSARLTPPQVLRTAGHDAVSSDCGSQWAPLLTRCPSRHGYPVLLKPISAEEAEQIKKHDPHKVSPACGRADGGPLTPAQGGGCTERKR